MPSRTIWRESSPHTYESYKGLNYWRCSTVNFNSSVQKRQHFPWELVYTKNRTTKEQTRLHINGNVALCVVGCMCKLLTSLSYKLYKGTTVSGHYVTTLNSAASNDMGCWGLRGLGESATNDRAGSSIPTLLPLASYSTAGFAEARWTVLCKRLEPAVFSSYFTRKMQNRCSHLLNMAIQKQSLHYSNEFKIQVVFTESAKGHSKLSLFLVLHQSDQTLLQ